MVSLYQPIHGPNTDEVKVQVQARRNGTRYVIIRDLGDNPKSLGL